jgi:hypothetical protein
MKEIYDLFKVWLLENKGAKSVFFGVFAAVFAAGIAVQAVLHTLEYLDKRYLEKTKEEGLKESFKNMQLEAVDSIKTYTKREYLDKVQINSFLGEVIDQMEAKSRDKYCNRPDGGLPPEDPKVRSERLENAATEYHRWEGYRLTFGGVPNPRPLNCP